MKNLMLAATKNVSIAEPTGASNGDIPNKVRILPWLKCWRNYLQQYNDNGKRMAFIAKDLQQKNKTSILNYIPADILKLGMIMYCQFSAKGRGKNMITFI